MNSYIVNQDYLIVLGNPKLSGIQSVLHQKGTPSNLMSSESNVFVFKRPTLVSLLCQKALGNSGRAPGYDALKGLRESTTVQSLDGFLKTNLLERIDKRIGDR